MSETVAVEDEAGIVPGAVAEYITDIFRDLAMLAENNNLIRLAAAITRAIIDAGFQRRIVLH